MRLKLLLIGSSGYVGSFLESKFRLFQDVDLSTCDIAGSSKEGTTYPFSYMDIHPRELLEFDVILFFAGTSSVGQAMKNPIDALQNNTLDLFEFCKKLDEDQLFIYASSGSVYSSLQVDGVINESQELDQLRDPTNVYDASKMIFDNLVKFLNIKSIGLRMGTVSGLSPNTRSDLVFNAMNLSALKEKKVVLKNSENFRTVLFLEDLFGLIESLIKLDSIPFRILNAGSCSLTIGSLAAAVSHIWSVPVVKLDDDGGYNFKLDLKLMESVWQPKCRDLQEQIELFRQEISNV